MAKSEPLRNKNCNRQECFIRTTEGGKCEKNGIGYEIKCEDCKNAKKKAVYEGETGRNGFTRGAEHQAALRLESEESPLWKHCLLEHEGRKARFSMKVCGQFESCLVRQVNEPVRIMRAKADTLLNSKSEFHQAPLVRVVALTGLQDEQEDRTGDTLGVRGAGVQAGRGRAGRGRARGRGAGTGGGGRGRGARTRPQGQ